MRRERFKMEREGLVQVGDIAPITEGVLPLSFYYTAEPAIAMSGNYEYGNRIKSKEGKVCEIEKNDRGFYLVIEFEE
ncbi:MAG: hypothetical protein K6F17_06070 [Lachnospiraceae bacterium]|nr:hypothetical protein [Lachnospiraceae bacterium]